jgi:serine/threonine protein kinase
MARGELDLVDARTDVYVLGAGLFELLTGQLPYERKTLIELLQLVRDSKQPRPRSVNPLVPPALDAICHRAMARLPENRYATVAELGQEVERWLAGEPVAAYPESLLRRWSRRLWGR